MKKMKLITKPTLSDLGNAIMGKGLKMSDVKYPFPAWTDMFPGSDSKYKCDTVGEAFVCLLSLILDH